MLNIVEQGTVTFDRGSWYCAVTGNFCKLNSPVREVVESVHLSVSRLLVKTKNRTWYTRDYRSTTVNR